MEKVNLNNIKEVNMAKTKKKPLKVAKHNSLINIKSEEDFTVHQKKLICSLIANIMPNEQAFVKKSVAISELGFIDDNDKNHVWFKKEFLKLLKMPFIIPNSDGVYVNWFSSLQYKRGVITYTFDPQLSDFLLSLKGECTLYSLDNVLRLKSNYSITLYEMLMKHKNMAYKNLIIEIDQIREYLFIPKSYQNKDVIRLISKIQKEIMENTSIQFDFEIIKKGASFHSISFKVKNNKKIRDVSYGNQDQKETIDLLKNGTQKTFDIGQNEELKSSVKEALKSLKVSL